MQSQTPNQSILLTAPGAAAIAVLRLIGPGVDEFLAKSFSRSVPLGRCVHGTLRDGDHVIDDPVIVRINESVIDINLHGGPWVVRSAIQLAESAGFSHCDSSLPLAVGAVDGTTQMWQEVLTHLPLAKTEQVARMLLAQPAAWDELERSIAASQVPPQEIQSILADRSAHWLLHPPTVAIAGPANVGKSTLANQLYAQERSITADLPGTTRDWVGEIANLDGLAVTLVDTPGVRITSDSIEQAAIIASGQKIQSADLVLIVLDQSAPISATDQTLLDKYPDHILIGNKSDIPGAWESPEAIATVATTGQGMDEVRSAIRKRFDCEPIVLDQPRWWTDRQRKILELHRIV
jgi:tRNA modification GTPase